MTFKIWKYLDKLSDEELLEMASPKKDLEAECDKQTETIFKHILLMGIYQSSLHAEEHWANEIATSLQGINRLTTKGTKSGKLKKDYYVLNVFLHYGDEVRDIESRIHSFRHDFCKPKTYSDNPYIRIDQESPNKKYPYFEITNEMIIRTFKFYTSLAERASEVLSTKNSYETVNFKNLVLEEYHKFCK